MDKTTKFDAAEYLGNEATAAAYLALVFEDGDSAEILAALNNVVRAHGVTKVARVTGLSREALYNALSDKGNPTFSTLLSITRAIGVKLSVAA